MIGDADISPVASLLGDPARARIVQALHDGRALPAGELARRAGVRASTASEHLAKLVAAQLLAVERTGRHRYFRLASADVAHAVEALAAIAPARTARSLRQAVVGEALAQARTCYDHLAGRLGVELTDALLERRAIVATADDFVLGPKLDGVLGSLGIAALPSRRREAVRCLDWSERRPHVGGALGAAICSRAFEQQWIERLPGSRAVRLTKAGTEGFASLGL